MNKKIAELEQQIATLEEQLQYYESINADETVLYKLRMELLRLQWEQFKEEAGFHF